MFRLRLKNTLMPDVVCGPQAQILNSSELVTVVI